MFKAQNIRCLVLAAGSARRFGACKLLHPLSDGRSILQHTLGLYSALFDQVTVVCNDNQELINQALALNASVEVNALSDQGMSESIKLGVSKTTPALAWLIVLADMPYVASASIIKLCQCAKRSKIIQARIDNKPANPVLIGRDFYSQLMQLQGDVGAKAIMQAHSDAVIQLDLNDIGLVHDIDRPSDIRI